MKKHTNEKQLLNEQEYNQYLADLETYNEELQKYEDGEIEEEPTRPETVEPEYKKEWFIARRLHCGELKGGQSVQTGYKDFELFTDKTEWEKRLQELGYELESDAEEV